MSFVRTDGLICYQVSSAIETFDCFELRTPDAKDVHASIIKKMPGGFQLCYILLPNPDNGMSNMSSATRICKSVNVLTLVDSSALSSTCRRFGTKGFDSAAVQ